MKKSLLAVPALLLTGCMAGPGPWHNQVGDYWNKQYQEQPIVTAVFSFIPVYPIVYGLAWAIPDSLFFNLVQFWGYDAWDGKGAAFTHENPKDPKKAWYDK